LHNLSGLGAQEDLARAEAPQLEWQLLCKEIV